MKVTVEKLPKSQVKVTVELTEELQKKYYGKAAEEISRMVKVPGVRPGHVPAEILKKHVREGAIESHMLDTALPVTYAEAVKKEKLQVITRPKVKILQDNPLKYEAVVAVYPDVEISGYDKFEVPNEEVKVEDKDIEDVLKDIQRRHATYSKVDREAKKGDRVEIDFEGFDEGGATLENTTSKHHPVIIGDGTMIADFEKELEGVKNGEDKEFIVTFPKEYFHKPFQNKKVKFKIHVHQVDEIKMPEYDAEFIKTIVGEEKTLDEVKQNIRENLLHEREHGAKVKREDRFLEKLAEKVNVEIPDMLLEEEIDSMMEEFKNEMENRGINFQTYLETTKKEIADLRADRKKEAENRLKLRFALQKIFEVEKIEATEDEMKHEIEHIKELYPAKEAEKVDKEYAEGGYLRTRLENKLRMDKLFERFLK